ncbi:MAG: STAS domain-containing protein, partial [Deltaproteobacteria bacterium]|nr:STAS domain-containing protein [Deltaproteobacteria bacterium]
MLDTRIERRDRTATIHVRGDLVLADVTSMYLTLRSAIRRRDAKSIVVDLAETKRLDSAGAATIALAMQLASRAGKVLTVENAADHHRIALDLAPPPVEIPAPEIPGAFENLGEKLVHAGLAARALRALVADIGRQIVGLVTRRTRLPAHAVADQIIKMGTNGVFIVGLMLFLLGMTMGFQGGVQMQRFGAGPYVAD